MSLGCVVSSLALMVMVAAAMDHAARHGPVSALWVSAYFVLLTIGELMVIPVGLTLVSELAPASAAAMAMGGWYIAKFLGSLAAGVMGAGGADPGHGVLRHRGGLGAGRGGGSVAPGIRPSGVGQVGDGAGLTRIAACAIISNRKRSAAFANGGAARHSKGTGNNDAPAPSPRSRRIDRRGRPRRRSRRRRATHATGADHAKRGGRHRAEAQPEPAGRAGGVSVVSSQALAKLHVTSLADIGGYVPGLRVTPGGTPGQDVLSLRGRLSGRLGHDGRNLHRRHPCRRQLALFERGRVLSRHAAL